MLNKFRIKHISFGIDFTIDRGNILGNMSADCVHWCSTI